MKEQLSIAVPPSGPRSQGGVEHIPSVESRALERAADVLTVTVRTAVAPVFGDAPLARTALSLVLLRSGAGGPWVCRDTHGDGAPPTLLAPLRAARAFAVVPVPLDPADEDVASRPHALALTSAGPRDWSAWEIDALTTVAALVGGEMGARAQAARIAREASELREHFLRDPLTDLPNMTLFVDRLAHAIERARRHRGFRFAVLSLDVDRFRAINDTLGHHVGDQVLESVAARISMAVRDEDTVTRASGDEFLVLLENLGGDADPERVGSRIQEGLASAIPTSAGDVFATVTIGAVNTSAPGATPGQLIQQAGMARQRAESAGAAFLLFDEAMQERSRSRLRLETDLRHALERDEFELHYQPMISLATGEITELEALIRWRHPERGVVSPLEFIGVAEDLGLILPIGAWVLRTAMRDARGWADRFRHVAPSVSVNLSARQLADAGLVATVRDALSATGLAPSALKLEVTESILIAEPDAARRTLEQLRGDGIGVYLDDFGTGYSSLQYLLELPLDALKIDRSFVERLQDGGGALHVARTVRELARAIGVETIAEGVQNWEQLTTLRQMGCENAQGYLFSPPIPARAVDALLAARHSW